MFAFLSLLGFMNEVEGFILTHALLKCVFIYEENYTIATYSFYIKT